MKYRIFLIIGLTIAIYGYSVGIAGFVAIDDYMLIVENGLLQSLSFASVKGMFTTFDPDLYIPLTLLSYHVDRIVAGGFNPTVFHMSNLVLHIANAVCVCIVLRKLSRNMWVGFATGVLFAVHPLHTEAVMWASARKDLLSTFLFLISWILYLKGRRAGIATFALALLAKVSVIGFPVILFLTDWYQGRTIDRKCIIKKVPYVILSIIFGIIAMIGMEGVASDGIATALLASRSILFYIQKILLPIGLSIFVPYYEPVVISNISLLLSFVTVIVLTACILWSRHKTFIFSWVLFLLFLVPSFGNYAKGNEYPLNIYLASDRYAYIASIGILFSIAVILERFRRRSMLLGIFVGVLSLMTFFQAQAWKDTPSLFINALEHYPQSYVARNTMAGILLQHGKDDLAIREYKKSIEYHPNAEAYYHLGIIAEKRNDMKLAREVYNIALDINPYHFNSYVAMAKTSLKMGNTLEAMQYLETAETYYPNNAVITKVRRQVEGLQ